ncbi:hypothetical protein [Lacipirellula parvula]|uniref:Methyl-accepting chemotaxis protein n=1 Tax=Lacipirellula parvula TaxID=2650471 RepID=A0A5K7XJL8_9BACT|nr:hypothetical protein [Lacipirellula parvula]BBO34596.1 methyl-accepting chemotaxis protein [Lacipirellula parvula]
MSIIGDLQEEINLRQEIARARMAERDAAIEAIQQQEKMLANAERQLQLEERKLQSFKAQIGALSPMEVDQLKDIDMKLKSGVDLNPFEMEALQRNGGDRGRREADKINAKRFDSLGIDSNTFLGGDGGAMKEAATAVQEMTAALKELTKGLSSTEAIAKLEDEKKELQKAFSEFKKEQIDLINSMIETLKLNNAAMAEIQMALMVGY